MFKLTTQIFPKLFFPNYKTITFDVIVSTSNNLNQLTLSFIYFHALLTSSEAKHS